MATPVIGKWYRLTNLWTGLSLALDVVNDAGTESSGTLQMTTTNNVSGQHWQFTYNPPSQTQTYALHTQFLGAEKRLDVYGDDKTKPHLANAGHFSGQIWTVTPLDDGTYRLSNSYSGKDLFLDIYRDTKVPFLGTPDHSGQHWVLTPL